MAVRYTDASDDIELLEVSLPGVFRTERTTPGTAA
jgi:hypothetical protein